MVNRAVKDIARVAALAVYLFALFAQANAEVVLPKVLGEDMVLQREQPVPIWGRASAGEEVTVTFAGQEKHAKAGAQGYWSVKLDPLTASTQPREMTISAGGETLRLHNILVGE